MHSPATTPSDQIQLNRRSWIVYLTALVGLLLILFAVITPLVQNYYRIQKLRERAPDSKSYVVLPKIATAPGWQLKLLPESWKEWLDAHDDQNFLSAFEVVIWVHFDNAQDADLALLESSTELIMLSVGVNTTVTDAGLVPIKRCTNLRHLNLTNTRITDMGLIQLAELNDLEDLFLENTAITDAGLVHIKGLSKLRFLTLTSTKITDAGLEQLKGLTNLKQLHLEGTEVTFKGIGMLNIALPDCDIQHEILIKSINPSNR